MKKKSWKSKLNKKELSHIKATTPGCLLREFLQCRENQKATQELSGIEPCWECRMIAIKLGIES